jgi:GNAT superfamily N-acetyltransferase
VSRVFIADLSRHTPQIRAILWEYLDWVSDAIFRAYQVNFDTYSLLEQNMQELGQFMPPGGRLLLCEPEDRPAGIACLKSLSAATGEIKRMYVRPEYRRQGVGKALLDRLLEEADRIGYESLRLDSARFMQAAHRLYRASGFTEIEPYPGSEIPQEHQKNWIFMERHMRREPS